MAKQKAFKHLESLEKEWPGQMTPELKAAFSTLRDALSKPVSGKLSPEKESKTEPPKIQLPFKQGSREYFDALSLLRRVLISHDLLFLSRQVTYHIAVDAELPNTLANPDQVQFLFSQLMEHLVKRSSRASRISIQFRKYSLRGGPGVEISFSTADRYLTEKDQNDFLSGLFQGGEDKFSGVSLTGCRTLALNEYGQMWVDIPKPSHPIYHLALPSTEQVATLPQAAQQTFKYDILISNYSDVRKRFGIRKSVSLVAQIENCVRSLVRYPIDMVMSLGEKGMITTIYETPKGTAHSVASRISTKLGSEKFCIGKKHVAVAFSYRLSPLAQLPITRAKTEQS